MSFVKALKNKGPRTDPCGTPVLVSFQPLKELLIFTFCCLFDRIASNELNGIHIKSMGTLSAIKRPW